MVSRFPIPIVDIISDYAMLRTLAPWMQAIEDDPDSDHLLDAKLEYLWGNPMADDELRPWIELDSMINSYQLSKNPADWAVDILEAKPKYRDTRRMAENSNPRAVEMVKDDIPGFLKMGHNNDILVNPGAIDILKKHTFSKFELDIVLANPKAPEIVDGILSRDFDYFGVSPLMSNPAPWAIELLKTHGVHLFDQRTYNNPHPFVCSRILANIDEIWDRYIFWRGLINKNPGMIDYLSKHPDRITPHIWRNPAIFELTRSPIVVDVLSKLSW